MPNRSKIELAFTISEEEHENTNLPIAAIGKKIMLTIWMASQRKSCFSKVTENADKSV